MSTVSLILIMLVNRENLKGLKVSGMTLAIIKISTMVHKG